MNKVKALENLIDLLPKPKFKSGALAHRWDLSMKKYAREELVRGGSIGEIVKQVNYCARNIAELFERLGLEEFLKKYENDRGVYEFCFSFLDFIFGSIHITDKQLAKKLLGVDVESETILFRILKQSGYLHVNRLQWCSFDHDIELLKKENDERLRLLVDRIIKYWIMYKQVYETEIKLYNELDKDEKCFLPDLIDEELSSPEDRIRFLEEALLKDSWHIDMQYVETIASVRKAGIPLNVLADYCRQALPGMRKKIIEEIYRNFPNGIDEKQLRRFLYKEKIESAKRSGLILEKIPSFESLIVCDSSNVKKFNVYVSLVGNAVLYLKQASTSDSGDSVLGSGFGENRKVYTIVGYKCPVCGIVYSKPRTEEWALLGKIPLFGCGGVKYLCRICNFLLATSQTWIT